jgi:hypothetical protein
MSFAGEHYRMGNNVIHEPRDNTRILDNLWKF